MINKRNVNNNYIYKGPISSYTCSWIITQQGLNYTELSLHIIHDIYCQSGHIKAQSQYIREMLVE